MRVVDQDAKQPSAGLSVEELKNAKKVVAPTEEVKKEEPVEESKVVKFTVERRRALHDSADDEDFKEDEFDEDESQEKNGRANPEDKKKKVKIVYATIVGNNKAERV